MMREDQFHHFNEFGFWAPDPDFEVGELVQLPDGLKATVTSVDNEAGELTVEGWHEVFDFEEIVKLARS